MKFTIHAVGKQREHVIDLPETLTFSVTRQDGYAPSEMEILTAMRMIVEGKMQKKKRMAKSDS